MRNTVWRRKNERKQEIIEKRGVFFEKVRKGLVGGCVFFDIIGLELIAPRKLWLESEYFGANKPNNSLNTVHFFFFF